MPGPNPANTDVRVRAFYLALASDPDATQLSADALRQAADGLAGSPVDGIADPVETYALLTIARQAGLPGPSIKALRSAIRERTPLAIPRVDAAAGPNRFPPYLDTASLRSATATDPGCGCGPSAGTMEDKDGNQMEIMRGDAGIEVRFARPGQSLEGQPTIALNAAERAAIAPQLMRAVLRQSQAAAPNDYDEDAHWAQSMGSHTPPTVAVPAERDLTGLKHWWSARPTSVPGERVQGYALGNGDDGMAWIRYNKLSPGQVHIAYSHAVLSEPAEAAFRPMTQREVETFMLSRRLLPIHGDLWERNYTPTQGFVSATKPEDDQ